MTRFLRGGVAVMAAGGMALAVASAAWPEDGADSHVERVFCPADARDPDRQARAAAACARMAGKEAILIALVHGDIQLADAVNRFIALNKTWPEIWPFQYDDRPGRSLQERIAKEMIEIVQWRFGSDPHCVTVTARLERELADAVRDGIIPIDDPAPSQAAGTSATTLTTLATTARGE